MAVHPASTRSASINVNSSGDNTVVAASTTGTLNVYAIIFTVNGATNITFKSGSTALSGPIVFTGNGSSMALQQSENPWFSCLAGNDFVINSSNAVTIAGMVYYTT